MRVSNVNNANVAASGKKTKEKASGGNFAGLVSGAAEEATATSSLAAVNPLGSLLALQEVDSDQESRSKVLKRGGDILDNLDEIRMGLLTGELPQSTLQNLENLIKTWRENIDDPELVTIIDEIELRSAVELAKREFG